MEVEQKTNRAKMIFKCNAFFHFPRENAEQQILFEEIVIRVLYRLRDLFLLESFRHFNFLSLFVFSLYYSGILFVLAEWLFFLAERMKHSLRFLIGHSDSDVKRMILKTSA